MTERPPGLRERKKQQAREHILDTAAGLFATHGFDQTTVAEVAEAAGVSTKTVFNYFPAKEDLFFGRAEDIEQSWLDAVADRNPGESVLAGLRRRALDRFANPPDNRSIAFRRVMSGSPLLQGRGQQMWSAHENTVAVALAEALRSAPADPTPRILAAQVLAVHPMALRLAEELTAAGYEGADVRERIMELINRAFDILERGIGA